MRVGSGMNLYMNRHLRLGNGIDVRPLCVLLSFTGWPVCACTEAREQPRSRAEEARQVGFVALVLVHTSLSTLSDHL